MTLAQQVQAFAEQWEKEQGYKPAAFQKAIAMQRLERRSNHPGNYRRFGSDARLVP